jgi:acetyl esterase/lipase
LHDRDEVIYVAFIDRVLPELRQGFLRLPELRLPQDLADGRQMTPPVAELSDSVQITNHYIPGADQSEMLIKVYRPNSPDTKRRPALLWIHGGGYVLGHPDADDALCQQFVQAADCVVLSPDYRLAPEHPFPAAIEDCYAALTWLAGAVDEWSIDASRIAIGGASAGGGLAAALALLARDRSGPAICFQMPLYPMIDERNETPSSYEIVHPSVWNRANNAAAWRMYLGEHADGEVSPYAAASRAESLAGLPPTYTCVGQLDPFRDETLDYVRRLAQAGVDVEFQLYPGCYHAFELADPHQETSVRARQGYIQALSRAFRV